MFSTLLYRSGVLGRLVLVLLTLSMAHSAWATHLLGGELTYRYLDANGPAAAPFRYEITVTIYNNCNPGAAAPNTNAVIGFYDQATGAKVALTSTNYATTTVAGTTGVAQQTGVMNITTYSLSDCLSPRVPAGCTVTGPSQPFQLQKFVGVVNLPAAAQGYYAVFTRSARNTDITNIVSASNQSALTLYATIAPELRVNHSPVFSDTAVALICQNDTTVTLNNASDADGDRLVYSFGTPYSLSTGNGVVPTGSFTPPPPTVTYSAGYSAATPFGTGAGNFAQLDASTGVARYGAMTQGKYVVAVDVSEYRTIGGQEVLIGITRRDLQLVVASCPNTRPPVLPPVAVMPRNYTVEAGSTLRVPITVTQADNHPLTMTLNSVLLDGAGGYDATFNGDPGTVVPGNPTGTTKIVGPNGSVTGTLVFATTCHDARTTPYDVALTVKDNGCAGKAVAEVLHITVTKPAGPTAIGGNFTLCTLNSVQTYTASGGTAPGISWRVVGGTIVGSSTANTIQVNWSRVGTWTLVARGVTQYGCLTDSVVQRVVVDLPPTIGLAGSTTICRGSSTTLALTGGASYTIAGGGTTVTGAGPFVLSPTQTTTYTITAVAASGCSNSTQATITVLPIPAANAGAATRTTCADVPITLGTATVVGSTYSWSPATGLSNPTAPNPTLTLPNSTGVPITRTYTLTETNSATGCQATHSVTVTVNSAPVADFSPALTLCSGSSIQLGAAAVTGVTYSWSPATGLSSPTAANPTLTLTNTTRAAIIRTYILTATNTVTGCVGATAVAVTVVPLPVAVPGSEVTICSGGTAQLGAAPVAGLTYSWSPTTGLNSSTIANPTATLTNTTNSPAAQTYQLTVTSINGQCVSSGTVTVKVNPLPAVVPGAAVTICTGGTAQLGAAPVSGLAYRWSPTTGLNNSTIANPTVTLTNATAAAFTQTYTLTVTNASTACTNTATVAVTVNPAVTPGTIGTDQTVCLGSVPAPLTGTTAGGGTGTYTYQWEASPDNSTWTSLAGATGATYTPGVATTPVYYRRRVISGECVTVVSNAVAVQVQAPVVASVTLPTLPAQCAGTAMTFTPVPANAGGAPTYRWFVNNTLVATSSIYTSSTLADGDQVRVELTPTVGFCAVGQGVATTTVALIPVPLPTVTIRTPTPLPVCATRPVVFNIDNITNAGTTSQYQWQINGVNVAGAQGMTFTSTSLRDGQTVTLVLRTTTACGQVAVTSNAVRVSVNPIANIAAGPNKVIMEGDQVELEGQVDGNYPVTWTPTATLNFTGRSQLRPAASPLVTTTYTLSATLGDCLSQSSVTVTVTPRVRIPNAFSPNGDGQDDTWEIDHIGDYSSNHVLVFNRWGNKVFEISNYSRGNEWNGTVSGQPAPVGTYYYVITLGNGKSYSGPLTVVY